MVMAQGVYHIFNMAKMRILEVANAHYPDTVSAKEIAHITGMEQNKVSRLLSYYHHHDYGYLRRMKKRNVDGSFKYKINKKGVKAYLALVLRVKQGFDLNLNRQVPIKIAPREVRRKPRIKSERDLFLTPEELSPYVRLSYRGEHELGIKPEDKLKVVGIIKEEPEELLEKLEVMEEPIEKLEASEVPETPVIQSKIYTIKGEQMSSEEMAEVLQFGIDKINKKLLSTSDVKIIKKLNDKKRKFLLWVHYNPDIKQFMK
jgi:hypothetical protein